MNPDLYKIVRLTNRTDFDFTPEMGARYNGVPYNLPAGKSMLLPKPVAKLLAKHLARQVFIKKAPVYGPSEIDGKGSDRPLWTEGGDIKLAETFISEEYEEQKVAPVSEAEVIKAKIASLNEVSDTPIVTPGTTTYLDKAQVIAELNKREIKFDARQNKAALERLLAENTAQ